MSPSPVMPLVAILDEEGQMTGITCPLNVGVDPHDIEGCEDLLESYFMQVGGCRHCPCILLSICICGISIHLYTVTLDNCLDAFYVCGLHSNVLDHCCETRMWRLP